MIGLRMPPQIHVASVAGACEIVEAVCSNKKANTDRSVSDLQCCRRHVSHSARHTPGEASAGRDRLSGGSSSLRLRASRSPRSRRDLTGRRTATLRATSRRTASGAALGGSGEDTSSSRWMGSIGGSVSRGRGDHAPANLCKPVFGLAYTAAVGFGEAVLVCRRPDGMSPETRGRRAVGRVRRARGASWMRGSG